VYDDKVGIARGELLYAPLVVAVGMESFASIGMTGKLRRRKRPWRAVAGSETQPHTLFSNFRLLLRRVFLGQLYFGGVELLLHFGEGVAVLLRRDRLVPFLDGAIPMGGC
jgi:hypothetical protein